MVFECKRLGFASKGGEGRAGEGKKGNGKWPQAEQLTVFVALIKTETRPVLEPILLLQACAAVWAIPQC